MSITLFAVCRHSGGTIADRVAARGGTHPVAAQEEQILSLIRSAGALPTIPAVALSIIRLSQDPDTTIEELARTLEKDPALAAKTLRFANSAYYGAAKPIVGLSQALVRVGLRGARMLALSFGLVEACSKQCAGFEFPPFWLRSLATATTARRIAGRSMRKLSDHAFVGALLADVGCPILARILPQKYKPIHKLSLASPKRLDEIEQDLLGISHPKVSSLLLESWHLPPEVVEAVAVHHEVAHLPRDHEAYPVAATIMAASDLTDIIIRGSTPRRVQRVAGLFREMFSFSAEHVGLVLQDIEPEIENVSKLLDVPLPPIELVHAKAKAEMLQLAMQAEADECAAAAKPEATT